MKKIQIEKEELYNLLNSTSKFFPRKSTLPILECYKLDVVPSAVKVTVSSIDSSIERVAPIMAFDSFTACISKDILPMVQKLPNGPVELEFNDSYLNITAGKASFTLATVDEKNYPELPKTEETEGIKMKASEFGEMLRSVEYAVSENETSNKSLTAVNFKVEDGKLQLTALDGSRIALQKKDISSQVKVELNIPSMSKYLKSMDEDDELTISWDKSRIVIRSADTKIVCRLIEGAYPDVNRFLKNDNVCEVSIAKNEFLEALERAALVAKSSGNKKPLMMEVVNDVMILQMEEAKGKFQELLDTKKTGSDLKVGFNVSFLIEALNKVTDDTIKLLFSGKKSPMLIKAGDKESDNFTHLILPVNTR